MAWKVARTAMTKADVEDEKVDARLMARTPWRTWGGVTEIARGAFFWPVRTPHGSLVLLCQWTAGTWRYETVSTGLFLHDVEEERLETLLLGFKNSLV